MDNDLKVPNPIYSRFTTIEMKSTSNIGFMSFTIFKSDFIETSEIFDNSNFSAD